MLSRHIKVNSRERVVNHTKTQTGITPEALGAQAVTSALRLQGEVAGHQDKPKAGMSLGYRGSLCVPTKLDTSVAPSRCQVRCPRWQTARSQGASLLTPRTLHDNRGEDSGRLGRRSCLSGEPCRPSCTNPEMPSLWHCNMDMATKDHLLGPEDALRSLAPQEPLASATMIPPPPSFRVYENFFGFVHFVVALSYSQWSFIMK